MCIMTYSRVTTHRHQKGISLLEILLALAIVAAVTIYITKMVNFVESGNKVDQSFTGKNKRRGLSARPRRLAIETPSLGSRGAIATSPVQALACSPDPAPANMPATFSDTQPNIAPTIIEMMMTTTGFSMEIAVRLPAPLPSNVKATTEAKP